MDKEEIKKTVKEAMREVMSETMFLTPYQSAKMLCIKDTRTLNEWVKKHNIEAHYVGKRKVYKQADIEKLRDLKITNAKPTK